MYSVFKKKRIIFTVLHHLIIFKKICPVKISPSIGGEKNPLDLTWTYRKLFDHADETQVNIAKHILKTLCTDATNILFNFLAVDLMMSVENPSSITSEVRKKPHLCFCVPSPLIDAFMEEAIGDEERFIFQSSSY